MKFEDIPAQLRWELASKGALSLSIAYGNAYRKVLDEETVRQVEESVNAEAGKNFKIIADSLRIPTKNASEISEAFHIIGMIFMGKMEYETIEATEDKVVMQVNNCGSVNLHKETDMSITFLQNICPFYSAHAVKSLNPKYTMNFNKKMCAGDECCEYSIELEK